MNIFVMKLRGVSPFSIVIKILKCLLFLALLLLTFVRRIPVLVKNGGQSPPFFLHAGFVTVNDRLTHHPRPPLTREAWVRQ